MIAGHQGRCRRKPAIIGCRLIQGIVKSMPSSGAEIAEFQHRRPAASWVSRDDYDFP
jgi:hypothetical protein